MKNKGVVWRNAQHIAKYDGDKIALRKECLAGSSWICAAGLAHGVFKDTK